MLLIHICGTSCSGKSALIQSLEDKVSCYDVRKDFYEKHGCLVDGVIDWEKWEQTIPQLIIEFDKFVASTYPPLIVESSGLNCRFNDLINDYEKKGFSVHKIHLRIPTEPELITRAKFKKVDPEIVLSFARMYRKKLSVDKIYSIEEARDYIVSLIRRERESQWLS